MGEAESKMRNVFAAGVPFVSSSVGRTHIGGELSHAATMTTVEHSDRLEGHFLCLLRRKTFRAVDRCGTPVRARAEGCRSKRRPGADVEAVRPVRRRRGGMGEARPCAESV